MRVIDMVEYLTELMQAYPEFAEAKVKTADRTGLVDAIGLTANHNNKEVILLTTIVDSPDDSPRVNNGLQSLRELYMNRVPNFGNDHVLAEMLEEEKRKNKIPEMNSEYQEMFMRKMKGAQKHDQNLQQEYDRKIRKDKERAIMQKLTAFTDMTQRLQIADVILSFLDNNPQK